MLQADLKGPFYTLEMIPRIHLNSTNLVLAYIRLAGSILIKNDAGTCTKGTHTTAIHSTAVRLQQAGLDQHVEITKGKSGNFQIALQSTSVSQFMRRPAGCTSFQFPNRTAEIVSCHPKSHTLSKKVHHATSSITFPSQLTSPHSSLPLAFQPITPSSNLPYVVSNFLCRQLQTL